MVKLSRDAQFTADGMYVSEVNGSGSGLLAADARPVAIARLAQDPGVGAVLN